ncbi:hypothetical protein [Gallibacterium anatis]|uniref:Uncharacterized protein n=1 Tax=Gallibacterium anatis TaxID=750 RepID=A0AAX3XDI5_9PAST|nr:hypothetical protein [Gallibacterium anatis]MDK9431472.1 hypothetical protein [Gallibacterium anatis]OZN49631.1 hypothetical protein CF595_04045 [Gallibacterium anatis]WIM79480.1 hypothetical protein QP018_12205 [Gallibacterium anatis]WIM84291.1 hypothetical protein QP020_11270 [Gallibacterium anatis]
MTSFSSLLPQSIVQSVISNHLKAGAVLRIFCDFTTPPKHKFVMVASVTPLQVFIINSEIHPYIRNNPDLLADQVDIPQADHSFLSHDSILNCIQAHQAFNISHLQQALLSDFSQIYKGNLRPYVLRNVIDVIEKSVNLPPITKKQIITAIKADNEL